MKRLNFWSSPLLIGKLHESFLPHFGNYDWGTASSRVLLVLFHSHHLHFRHPISPQASRSESCMKKAEVSHNVMWFKKRTDFPSHVSLPAGKAWIAITVAWQQKSGFPEDSLRCIRNAFCHKRGHIKRHPYTLAAKNEQFSDNNLIYNNKYYLLNLICTYLSKRL